MKRFFYVMSLYTLSLNKNVFAVKSQTDSDFGDHSSEVNNNFIIKFEIQAKTLQY